VLPQLVVPGNHFASTPPSFRTVLPLNIDNGAQQGRDWWLCRIVFGHVVRFYISRNHALPFIIRPMFLLLTWGTSLRQVAQRRNLHCLLLSFFWQTTQGFSNMMRNGEKKEDRLASTERNKELKKKCTERTLEELSSLCCIKIVSQLRCPCT